MLALLPVVVVTVFDEGRRAENEATRCRTTDVKSNEIPIEIGVMLQTDILSRSQDNYKSLLLVVDENEGPVLQTIHQGHAVNEKSATQQSVHQVRAKVTHVEDHGVIIPRNVIATTVEKVIIGVIAIPAQVEGTKKGENGGAVLLGVRKLLNHTKTTIVGNRQLLVVLAVLTRTIQEVVVDPVPLLSLTVLPIMTKGRRYHMIPKRSNIVKNDQDVPAEVRALMTRRKDAGLIARNEK